MARSLRNCAGWRKVSCGVGGWEKGIRMKTTHIVISGVFNSCDCEDKNQRHNGGEPGEGGDLWDQLNKGKRRHASEAPSSFPLDLSLP